MNELAADAWTQPGDILAVTTNGSVREGRNIMGAGVAGEAARRFPFLPAVHGKMLEAFDQHVFLLPASGTQYVKALVTFPTIVELGEPANLDLIEQSMSELVTLANLYHWQSVLLPRPGAGLGGLDWHTEVKPVIEDALTNAAMTDRFTIISYPGER